MQEFYPLFRAKALSHRCALYLPFLKFLFCVACHNNSADIEDSNLKPRGQSLVIQLPSCFLSFHIWNICKLFLSVDHLLFHILCWRDFFSFFFLFVSREEDLSLSVVWSFFPIIFPLLLSHYFLLTCILSFIPLNISEKTAVLKRYN